MTIPSLEIIPGTPGLKLARVGHLLIPGRGRDVTGMKLAQGGVDRINAAKYLYDMGFPGADRSIICSGYKSPSDKAGQVWSPTDFSSVWYSGIPEADLMQSALIQAGLPKEIIQVERNSIDTVTNLLRTEGEGYFRDDAPVAIIAQRAHLERILKYIAPVVLAREFIGVVVPEPNGVVREGVFPRLSSLLIARHLPSDYASAIDIATRRAKLLWGLSLAFGTPRGYTST